MPRICSSRKIIALILTLNCVLIGIQPHAWARPSDRDRAPVVAEGAHAAHELHHTSMAKNTVPSDLQGLARLIHESVTGEAAHGTSWRAFFKEFFKLETWKRWLKGLIHLGKTLLNYKRAVNILRTTENADETVNHAQNIFILLGMGESIEMFVIPALGTYYNLTSSASPLVKTIVGTAAYLTPLPGVEPACLTLVSCYVWSKTFRKGVNLVRTGISRLVVSQFRLALDQISSVDSPLTVATEVLSALRDHRDYRVVTESTKRRYTVKLFSTSPKKLIFEMRFRLASNGLPFVAHLQKFVVNRRQATSVRTQLTEAMSSLFGKNVRSAITEVLENMATPQDLEDRFYIERTDIEGNRLTVVFRDPAISVERQRLYNREHYIHSRVSQCEALLNAS